MNFTKQFFVIGPRIKCLQTSEQIDERWEGIICFGNDAKNDLKTLCLKTPCEAISYIKPYETDHHFTFTVEEDSKTGIYKNMGS